MIGQAFLGVLPRGYVTNHIDGVKRNNVLQNLEYISVRDSNFHAYRIGLKTQLGSKNASAKLTDEQVLYIRASALRGREIAKELAVSDSTISLIRSRKNWSHL